MRPESVTGAALVPVFQTSTDPQPSAASGHSSSTPRSWPGGGAALFTAHSLFVQIWLPGQLLPHFPQLLSSLVTSTHTPSHTWVGGAQASVSLPELEPPELVGLPPIVVLEVTGSGPLVVSGPVAEGPVDVDPLEETGSVVEVAVVGSAVVTPPEDDDSPVPVGSSNSGLPCLQPPPRHMSARARM